MVRVQVRPRGSNVLRYCAQPQVRGREIWQPNGATVQANHKYRRDFSGRDDDLPTRGGRSILQDSDRTKLGSKRYSLSNRPNNRVETRVEGPTVSKRCKGNKKGRLQVAAIEDTDRTEAVEIQELRWHLTMDRARVQPSGRVFATKEASGNALVCCPGLLRVAIFAIEHDDIRAPEALGLLVPLRRVVFAEVLRQA